MHNDEEDGWHVAGVGAGGMCAGQDRAGLFAGDTGECGGGGGGFARSGGVAWADLSGGGFH